MGITRRNLLKISLGTTGYALLSPWSMQKAFAQTTNKNFSPRLLLHLRINGGWDTPMCMDAFDLNALKKRNISSKDFAFENARKPTKAYKHGFLGKCMKPLEKYMNDIAIVNGIMMISDNSVHENNRDYMSQGTTDRSAGFVPVQLAKQLHKVSPQRVGFRLEYEDFQKSGHNSVVHLSTLGKNQNTVESDEDKQFDFALMEKAISDAPERDSQGAMIQSESIEKPKILALNKVLPNIRNVFSDGSEETTNLGNALAGLASGYLQMVCVDIVQDRDLDTHDDHVNQQTQNLTEGMNRIAKTIEVLKKTPFSLPIDGKIVSLFDITTVVVTGEFARTAWKEGSSGSSHNQKNNSAILFGRGIQGGQLIGRSQVYSGKNRNDGLSLLHAVPYDFKLNKHLSDQDVTTLAADQTNSIGKCSKDACVDYIYPETIWRAVAKSFNVKELPDVGLGNSLDILLKK